MAFYCPTCKRLDIDFKLDRGTPYVVNIRDGYGRPLYHIKCECGNYLAAAINFTKEELEKDEGLLDYIVSVISGYNKGGCFYADGYYEYVEKRILDEEKRRLEASSVFPKCLKMKRMSILKRCIEKL